MKRIIILVAALALVFGLAAAASADSSITGKFEFRGKYGVPASTWDVYSQSSELKLTAFNDWGPASGDITYKLSTDSTETIEHYLYEMNFTYKLTPSLKLGASYMNYGNDGYYRVLAHDAEIIELYTDWYFDTTTVLKGTYTFQGGSVTAISTADLSPTQSIILGTYATGRLTLAGWLGLGYNDGSSTSTTADATRVLVKAVYKPTDQITLTGEGLYSTDQSDETLKLPDLAFKGEYRNEGKVAYLRLGYDLDNEWLFYKIYGELPVIQNVIVYGWYEDDPKTALSGVVAGAKYTFGADTYFCAEYVQKDNDTVYFKLVGAF